MDVPTVCLLLAVGVCSLQIDLAVSKETTEVKTDVGTFVGYVRTFSTFGHEYRLRKFQGVPYAVPPVGERRFQKPQKKAKLEQKYDATKRGAACLQTMINPKGIRNKENVVTFSEDCLFLNIFAPDKPKTALPVMVFFHGGGFVFGMSDIYQTDVLSAYGDVIVVTVNYRLSIWGFLSTGDSNLPGNYGLWDQHTAIQWVHENIAAFGGDPELVTIFGNSAGSTSVIYQGLYPGNKGMFKRIIGHSGSITCPWAFNPEPLTVAKRVGTLLGCTDQSSSATLANCIKSKSTEELDHVLNNNNGFITFPMELVTVIDGEFIPESPTDLFHGTSNVAKSVRSTFASFDFMTGVVSNEGLMMITPFVNVNDTEGFEVDRERFETELVPEIVRVMFGEDTPEIVKDIVIAEYTDWDNPGDPFRSRESFLQLSSDYTFNIQAIETVKIHAENSDRNTYLYLFDAFPSQHVLPTPSWTSKTNHVDELIFLFGHDNEEGLTSWTTPYGKEPELWEFQVSKETITRWTNFARSGDPNSPRGFEHVGKTTWPQYNLISEHYLNISQTTSVVGQRLFAKSVNFWVNVLPGVIETMKGRDGSTAGEMDSGYCEKDGGCRP